MPNWPDHVTGDEMVAAMGKIGVDGAIFISAFFMYQYDASYAVEVQQAHPDRFAIVKSGQSGRPGEGPSRLSGHGQTADIACPAECVGRASSRGVRGVSGVGRSPRPCCVCTSRAVPVGKWEPSQRREEAVRNLPDLTGDRGFESTSLQRRVSNKLDFRRHHPRRGGENLPGLIRGILKSKG